MFRDTIRLNLLPDPRARTAAETSAAAARAAAALAPSQETTPISAEWLQSFPDAVLVVRQDGSIQDANAKAVEVFRTDREALCRGRLGDLCPRLDAAVTDLLFRSAEQGTRVVVDVLIQPRVGEAFAVELIPVLHSRRRPSGSETALVVRTGRTSEDQAGLIEARIARAERLEMAGTLAGQIAHDFNNLLTPLLAYPEMIRQELAANSPAVEYVNIVEKTAGDMQHLTQQLLSLSRRGQMGQEVFSLNDVVKEVADLLRPAVDAGIAIETDLADNLLPVKGGRGQMRRVVQNLCQNSLDAMADSGRLRIRTDNVYLDAPFGQYDTVRVGEYVKLTVSDTGSGIPEEIKDRIFDPFFTTKRSARHRGAGLGLSIVHGIIKDHGGYVDLETQVGRGTAFFVYIPICREKVAGEVAVGLPRGTETILVVDDDAPQVQVLTDLLGSLGYRVTGVRSGEEALRLIEQERRAFDLVILDMIMDEGLSGLQTFLRLRATTPGQKVMLISGFARAAPDVAAAQQRGAGGYLRKPLTIERVARSVRQELDGTPAAAASAPGAGSAKRILIVDDDRTIRRLFAMIITSEFPTAVIEQADNGEEAIVAFANQRHDVIIMDLQMPLIDGRETFTRILGVCGERHWKPPAVIFCTGYAPPASLGEIIGRPGQSRHTLLRKPVKSDTLLQAVRERL
jgi:signal transduction histidine kinase/CheY-like chemotaxis protein